MTPMTVTSSNECVRETVSHKPKIKVCKYGPYSILGAIPLFELTVSNDAEDCPCDYHVSKRFPLQEDYSLCRCGQSRDKPFCDKTHEAAHFRNRDRKPSIISSSRRRAARAQACSHRCSRPLLARGHVPARRRYSGSDFAF
jgi:CDGSH-type Zn-finger protein